MPNITANMSSSSVRNVAAKSNLHSHKAKVEILSSIFNLLNAGLARGSNDPYWFFAEYLGDKSAKKRFRLKFSQKKAVSDTDQVAWHADGSVRNRTVPFSCIAATCFDNKYRCVIGQATHCHNLTHLHSRTRSMQPHPILISTSSKVMTSKAEITARQRMMRIQIHLSLQQLMVNQLA